MPGDVQEDKSAQNISAQDSSSGVRHPSESVNEPVAGPSSAAVNMSASAPPVDSSAQNNTAQNNDGNVEEALSIAHK